VSVKAANGKPAELTYSLTRGKRGWTGTIRISDPAARLRQSFALSGTPKISSAGAITGIARATVHHHRRTTLRFELSPA